MGFFLKRTPYTIYQPSTRSRHVVSGGQERTNRPLRARGVRKGNWGKKYAITPGFTQHEPGRRVLGLLLFSRRQTKE